MQRYVDYWDKYYNGNRREIEQPSGFAKFAMSHIKNDGKKLIDIGCGNGRDSIYFCCNGLKVTAVDSSASAIECINNKSLPIFAVCDDFVKTNALTCVDYDYCYARWSIHAINQAQQDELLPKVYLSLNEGGLFFIEARTTNDVKYGEGVPLGEHEYFFENHYRRFLEPEKFKKEIIAVGFEIISFEQSDTFSVMGNDTPTLIRIVAKKA